MARRVPPGLRGWWRYSRLVGWRVTVLVAAVVGSALGGGDVLPGAEGDWTVGYGYQTWRALIGLLVILVAGAGLEPSAAALL